ncbi:MAG TPA: hypothetical protein VFS43_09795 [Polyangiaceae bacterium]|nr:hypothetical protein [Polyangiaceae bacterium]
MAKLSVFQKAERALRLLVGLRNPRIAAALKAHGFRDRDLDEGWALLRGLGVETLERVPTPPPKGEGLNATRGLDAWENKWFPIASATLARRVPEGRAWLFHDLSQASGHGAIISVSTFLDRYERLAVPKAEGGLGALGEGVRALLAERGLNEGAIAEAKALLRELKTLPGGGGGPSAEAERASLAEAEAALWAWCLEWGAVARAAIRERDLLRQLGFLRAGSGGSAEGDDEGGERQGAKRRAGRALTPRPSPEGGEKRAETRGRG